MMLRKRVYKLYTHRIYPKIEGVRGATRLARYMHRFSEIGIEKVSSEGTPVNELEWDNLIVLDACRHDLYEEVEGTTKSRISRGSCTKDFLRKNFSEGDFSDVVYISGNPHTNKRLFKKITGREIEDTFHTVYQTFNTDWDSRGTIMPEPLIRDTQTAEKLFPNKRKIIHFLQPHVPFIEADFDVKTPRGERLEPDAEKEAGRKSIWKHAEDNKIDRQEIWDAYKQNLEIVIDDIKKFAQDLDGKSVITSDHGNLVGENGLYGHPCRSRTVPLRKVPWDEVSD